MQFSESTLSARRALRHLHASGQVEHLVKHGGARGGIEMKDKFGRSALAAAAQAGKLDVVRLLAAEGADVDTENKQGLTPCAQNSTISRGSDLIYMFCLRAAHRDTYHGTGVSQEGRAHQIRLKQSMAAFAMQADGRCPRREA
jgi:hypothetical protein